jgi:hypothetical protein
MSDVVMFGDIKLLLDKNDDSKYVKIISTQLRSTFMKGKILGNNESLYLLERFSKDQLEMRIPDLKYIITNPFESLIERDFFQK